MPDKATEFLQDRARLVSEQRVMIDAAEAEDRDFTAEEQEKYDRLGDEAKSLMNRSLREQSQRADELGLADPSFDPRGVQDDDAALTAEDRVSAYADVFTRYMKHGVTEMNPDQIKLLRSGWNPMAADQAVGTAGLGGYLVPTEFRRQLIEFLTLQSPMRAMPTTKIVTASGNPMLIPRVTDTGEAFLVGEAQAVTADAVEFDQKQLNAWKYARLVKASTEIVEDSAFDLPALLSRKIGGSIGAKEGQAYISGNGIAEPEGVLTVATQGADTTGPITVVTDDFLDLFFSVATPYRRNGVWMISDTAMGAIRKLKDGDERYILDVATGGGGVNGSPSVDLLLGKPVFETPDLEDFGVANKKFAMFGDFSAYWIRDVGSAGPTADETGSGDFLVRRLDERYAEVGQVGFIAFHRTDGGLIGSPDAIKYLQHAPS
jgi:HK97 family phage major capsid protein